MSDQLKLNFDGSATGNQAQIELVALLEASIFLLSGTSPCMHNNDPEMMASGTGL